jgi:hypothetical protein
MFNFMRYNLFDIMTQLSTFIGIMIFYVVLSYILFPIVFYYLMGKSLASGGIGFVVGSLISIVLWFGFGYKTDTR